MKQTILILLIVLIFGCKSESEQNKIELADINLIVKTDTSIDSVWISNIGQTESFFLPFKDTIKVDFQDKLNDLYNIGFFTKNGRKTSQLWLNGDNVIIKGRLNDQLEIDSVQNSDLYYESVNFSKKIGELVKNGTDSLTIDRYLLEKIRENVNSPFSFVIANSFIYRNQNNKSKIGNLFDKLSVQDDTLKNHFISIHGKIESILTIDSLRTTDYKFANIENKLSSIELNKSKKYLFDIWFINCPPCVRDHKMISNKLDLLKDNNVELIGISTDRDHSDWTSYLKKHNYNWKNFREIDSLKRITKDMGIWSFPTYIFLDSSGEIKARFNSFEDFENYLSK